MAFRKMYNILCGDQTLYRTYLHNGITRHIKNPLNVTLLHRPIKKIMSWNIQELFWYSKPKKLDNVIEYLKRSDCDVVCLAEADIDGVCDELEINGCTDSAYLEFDSTATEDDG